MERCQCLMVHRNCTEYRTTYLDPGRLLCNLPISSVRLTVIRGLGAAVGGYAEETPMVGWMAWMVSDVDGFSWVFVGFGSLVVAWGSWSPDALRNKGKSEMERGSEREREREPFFPSWTSYQLPCPAPSSHHPPNPIPRTGKLCPCYQPSRCARLCFSPQVCPAAGQKKKVHARCHCGVVPVKLLVIRVCVGGGFYWYCTRYGVRSVLYTYLVGWGFCWQCAGRNLGLTLGKCASIMVLSPTSGQE